jgi:hypothetical protein
MPTTTLDNRNVENEPYNNKLVSELIEEAYSDVNDDSILVADDYYPDRMGRKYCRSNEKLYLFKEQKAIQNFFKNGNISTRIIEMISSFIFRRNQRTFHVL